MRREQHTGQREKSVRKREARAANQAAEVAEAHRYGVSVSELRRRKAEEAEACRNRAVIFTGRGGPGPEPAQRIEQPERRLPG